MHNASMTASSAGTVLEAWASQLVVVTSALGSVPKSRRNELIHNFLTTGNEFLGFELLDPKQPSAPILSEWRKVERGVDQRYVTADPAVVAEKLRLSLGRHIKKMTPTSGMSLVSLGPDTGLPVLAMILPLAVKGKNHPVFGALVAWQSRLHGALTADGNDVVHLVDEGGKVQSSSQPQAIIEGKTLSKHPLLKAAKSGASEGFKSWRTKDKKLVLGGYAQLPVLGLTVWTEADGEPAFDAISMVVKRSVLWAALILMGAIFFSLWAATGITSSLRNLTAATVGIASGNFDAKASVRSNDEVGLLGLAVNHMGSQIKRLMGDQLEKARLETEMATAKYVQDKFIPLASVSTRHLAIASHFEPATECGGDWWGHYDLGDDVHLVCIADATGHGLGPALVTAMVFAASSVVAQQLGTGDPHAASPAAVLTEFNRMLGSSKGESLTMTFFAAVIDLKRGVLTFSNAGHNFPLVAKRTNDDGTPGVKRSKLMLSGAPLGYEQEVAYRDKTVPIAAGDRVIFYTDGLTEHANQQDEHFGNRRMLQLIDDTMNTDIQGATQALIKAVKDHAAGVPADDDITLVMVEISPDWINPALSDEPHGVSQNAAS